MEGLLKKYRHNEELLTIIGCFNGLMPLLSTSEVPGGKWWEYKLDHHGDVYRIKHDQGSICKPEPISFDDHEMSFYFSAKYRCKKRPSLVEFKTAIESEIECNIDNYLKQALEQFREWGLIEEALVYS